MTTGLSVAAVLGCGLVAGVLFAVWLTLVPGLAEMPPDRYVYAHQIIGGRWDPTMPIIVLSSAALDIALVFAADGSNRWLFGVAAVVLVAVSVVSHFCNVPINRQVKELDHAHLPADWWDPRPLWRRWHALRTALSVLALILNAAAAAMH